MLSLIAVIAPNKDVEAVARAAAGRLPFPVDILLGDQDTGVEAARALLKKGPYILISRGGTALRMRRELNDVVVEIPVAASDILMALSEASRYGRRIVVAGFPEAVAGAARAGELLNLQVQEIPVDYVVQYDTLLGEQDFREAQVVVGDTHVVRAAQSIGLPAVLIRSSPASVLKACHEAMRIAQVRLLEQARGNEIRTVLQSVDEGIIAVDERGEVTLFNPVAEGLLHRRAADVLSRPVRDLIPELRLHECIATGRPESGRVVVVNNLPLAVNTIPIQVGHNTTGALAVVQSVRQLQRVEAKVRRELMQRGHVARTVFTDLVGGASRFRDAIEAATRYAAADSSVLIIGETGTGKELFAQSIHNASARREGPFVAINCAALPESLLESELFGYAEGAFTDARKGGKPGVFELAHRGTLFLDEIGEMPLLLQVRLLRVLQQREVMRLGGDRLLPVDVRVIAATNRDLSRAVQRGDFRADLYYRLHVLRLRLPPLRERPGDVAILAEHFLERLSRRYGRRGVRLADEVLDRLEAWHWPGNVRELENLMERLLVESGTDLVGLDILRKGGDFTEVEQVVHALPIAGAMQVEPRMTLEEALAQADGNQSEAARLLGINRTTLWRRLRRQR